MFEDISAALMKRLDVVAASTVSSTSFRHSAIPSLFVIGRYCLL
jgi:hypothetical protein